MTSEESHETSHVPTAAVDGVCWRCFAIFAWGCGDDDDDDRAAGGAASSRPVRSAGEGQARGHARHEGLHRGVRARRALQAGARGQGLQGQPEEEHRRRPRSSTRRSTSGQIDGYPEYLGVSVAVVAGKDIVPKSDQETYDLAKDFYEGRGQVISEQTPFFDVDAIATTKDFADKNGLKTVADLKKLGSFTVGARPEFRTASRVSRGCAASTASPTPSSSSWRSESSTRRSTRATWTARTCSRPTPSWRAASTWCSRTRRASSATSTWRWSWTRTSTTRSAAEAFFDVINEVSALLTNDAMISMNKAVAIDKQDEAEVAEELPRGQQPAVAGEMDARSGAGGGGSFRRRRRRLQSAACSGGKRRKAAPAALPSVP